jgi:hypothetical protein
VYEFSITEIVLLMQQGLLLVVRPGLSSSNLNFSNPRSSQVEQQNRIFATTKSRITNVSVLELMHEDQTNTSIACEIEIRNS